MPDDTDREIETLRRDLHGAILAQMDLEERTKASIRALADRLERLEWLLDLLRRQVARDVRVVIETECRHPPCCGSKGARET